MAHRPIECRRFSSATDLFFLRFSFCFCFLSFHFVSLAAVTSFLLISIRPFHPWHSFRRAENWARCAFALAFFVLFRFVEIFMFLEWPSVDNTRLNQFSVLFECEREKQSNLTICEFSVVENETNRRLYVVNAKGHWTKTNIKMSRARPNEKLEFHFITIGRRTMRKMLFNRNRMTAKVRGRLFRLATAQQCRLNETENRKTKNVDKN